MKQLFILIALTVVTALPVQAGKYGYDPDADPYAVLAATSKAATAEAKLILVVFGSDWCPDCRSLNKKMGKKPLAETIQKNFVVMHVDVGEWDKNLEFTRKFGKPIGNGIPSVAILASDEFLYYVAEGGEFATARKSKVKPLNEWFASIAEKINSMTAQGDERTRLLSE